MVAPDRFRLVGLPLFEYWTVAQIEALEKEATYEIRRVDQSILCLEAFAAFGRQAVMLARINPQPVARRQAYTVTTDLQPLIPDFTSQDRQRLE